MGPACDSRLLANDEGGRRAGTEVQMAKSINFLCWWDSKLKATRDGGFGRGGRGGLGLVDEEATAGGGPGRRITWGVGPSRIPGAGGLTYAGSHKWSSAPLPGPPCRTRDPYLLASTLPSVAGSDSKNPALNKWSRRNTSLDSNCK